MHKPKSSIMVIVLLFALFGASLILAQTSGKPVVTKKVGFLKTRNAALEKALRKWNDGDNGFRYHYNAFDLNADGKNDAIVFVSGSQFCGSGGCRILIFKGNGEGYDLVTEMSVSRPPVLVASTKTQGWSDLLFYNSGGGIKPYYSLLKFNGKTYPNNPTVEPALSKKNKQTFVEYLSGIENFATGLEIK